MDRRIVAAASAAVVLTGLANAAKASSYASGITESGGNVNFVLNEAVTNGEVVVIRDGVAQSLGALGKGSHTFARNGATNYQVLVKNRTFEGYQNAIDVNLGSVQQITDDSTPWQFERPVGLTINTNPAAGAAFGRVYVSNPREVATGTGRPMISGIYVNNADGSEAVAGGHTGLTGGIAWTDSTANPWKLALDGDGNVYVGDWSDTSGTVYRTGPNVGTAGGVNLFAGKGATTTINQTTTLNHGSIAAIAIRGRASDGTLQVFTIDEDTSTATPPSNTGTQGVYRYDVGSTPSGYSTPGTRLASPLLQVPGVVVDMDMAPDGKIFLSQYRGHDGATNQEPIVFVLSADGSTVLYDSKADAIARGIDGNTGLDGIQDPLRYTRDIAVSPDGDWMAATTNLGGDTWVVPLIGGIPDLPNRLLIDTMAGSTGDTASFDAAGNLYVGNRSAELVRAFAPSIVSQTVYNSNGTFTVRNDPEWDVAGSGNYTDASKWLLGYVPNDSAFVANTAAKFGNTITAPSTVTMDAGTRLGYLKFDSANKYTIAGPGTITLDSLGEPRVIVKSGSHDVTAPVVANKNLQVHVQRQADNLTMANLTLAPAATLTKSGAGTFTVGNVRAAGLAVNEGTVAVAHNGSTAGVSKVGSLAISPTGRLNVNDNDLLVDYTGASQYAAVRDLVRAGLDGSDGITVDRGAQNDRVLALVENSDRTGGPTTWNGVTIDATTVIGKYTYFGDGNMDGRVSGEDYGPVDANLGRSTIKWIEGDYNYDGVISGEDYGPVDANLGKGTSNPLAFAELKAEMIALHTAQFGEAYLAALSAAESGLVPEPAGLGLLAVGATGLLARRRRRTA